MISCTSVLVDKMFNLLLIGLAAHRLMGVWANTQALPQWFAAHGGPLKKLGTCAFCIATWAGLITASLHLFGGIVGQVINMGLAAGTCVGILDILGARLSRPTPPPVSG